MGETHVGRYELIDRIGDGGMGAVWRVRDLKSGEIVAAKVLRQSNADGLLRFIREQAVRIHHPHIIVPLGWAGDDDKVLFTMPLVTGGSLEVLIGDFGPLPPLFASEILRQVLDALAAVHAAGVIHRDVKPSNILLEATGTGLPHAYLSDFGIAVDPTAPRLTVAGAIPGTPGYAAPELARLADPSPATDLYAAGMVAIAMLTGGPPHPVTDEAPPPGCPAGLWELVGALTAVNPADRPELAAARSALNAGELAWHPEAIGDVEVFDQLPATIPVAAQGSRPPWLLIGSTAVLLLGLILLLVGLLGG